ncbi:MULTISPECIES: DUF3151 domain-containing protein [unclassified Saccharopolyspora]|uniref:DUF3151 domain-containing protein n=1 Tax=unclassified Saccharopolyspora TaxID=2646250 RepID=UPI001CD72FD1|nr:MULTISPECIES: DUF3151 domain-containing protein [unclassified Saccharopolyspora]MCA1189513.1 DUF3151 domain-containing protein [Saccharopolyspora sp. 6T]MCA1195973.1 DUF3151 domain-containing protein [Saccharopolyspora sp. 6V]MCA1228871.1 DUF3151 domain-containing protein [Saccharopolyspora sp. 6M]MCA1282613.1 DUF3151 domain-containing protein [Saccharopolyspora sp. 7B]
MTNLLEPPETLLPENEPAQAALDAGTDPALVAAEHPTFSAAWAQLGEAALERGETIAAYAYARTGYHRGLDALRRSGWKGFGPVPWRHRPNQGVLRAVAVLAKAAGAIGETDEFDRCRQLLLDSDPASVEATGLA